MSGGVSEVDAAKAEVPDERLSIAELIGALGEQVRAAIEAEATLYRAEAERRALSAGWAAGFLIAAITLAQGALIAMLVGLIMVLSQRLGTEWAVVAVTLAALALAGLLAWLAVRQVNRMLDPDKAA